MQIKHLLIFYIVINILCVFSIALRAEEDFVMKTYKQLVNSKLYPKDVTDEDSKAIKIIKNNTDKISKHLIKVFSKGGRPEKNTKAILWLLSSKERLHIARESIKTYPIGSKKNPLLVYIAYYGEDKDMERIGKEIAVSPDKEGVELARCLSDSGTVQAHKLLIKLKDKVPGKWQEAIEVKKFLKGTNNKPLLEKKKKLKRLKIRINLKKNKIGRNTWDGRRCCGFQPRSANSFLT